jgi:hypothetical protein
MDGLALTLPIEKLKPKINIKSRYCSSAETVAGSELSRIVIPLANAFLCAAFFA